VGGKNLLALFIPKKAELIQITSGSRTALM
jgi:hypothetical protein